MKKSISEMTRIEKLGIYLKYANDEKMKDYVQEILAGEDFAMAEKAYRSLTQDEIEFQRMNPKYEVSCTGIRSWLTPGRKALAKARIS